MKDVTTFWIKVFFPVLAFSSDLAQNWEPIVSGNVDSPRTPHNLVGGPEHKGLELI